MPQALTHFFRIENLVALRELALRFLADETEEDLLEYLQRRGVQGIWETTERIAVAVTAAPGTEAIVRRAARIAARVKGDLHVVHIRGDSADRSSEVRLDALRQLTTDIGATWHEVQSDDPVQGLVGFARLHQITQIVLGSSQRSRWQELRGGGSIVRRIVRHSGAAGIDVHIIARRDIGSAEPDAAVRDTAVQDT